jgi:hypothetical protein
MPVIIDQLDLVDTEPDPPRESGAPAPRPAPADAPRDLTALRVAARRSARVHAD